ncbi:hypothetical protein [Micromonospora sp. RP3T]|uniref:hypothetical protein n=1 Tax=Micromonospora sp. RP3T TaxID=2135446 RepID=UPI003D71F548
MTSASVRRRMRRRLLAHVWGVRPVLSPYTDRLAVAALGDHHCQHMEVHVMPITRRNDETEQPVQPIPVGLDAAASAAVQEAKSDKDLPNPDTDSKQAAKDAK